MTDLPALVDASVVPDDHMQTLSKREIDQLYDGTRSERYALFRCCALAVLNTGSQEDDTAEILERYKTFDLRIIQRERGIKLEIKNAPAQAFVDGRMIQGIKEHLFSVLRDIIYCLLYTSPSPRD